MNSFYWHWVTVTAILCYHTALCVLFCGRFRGRSSDMFVSSSECHITVQAVGRSETSTQAQSAVRSANCTTAAAAVHTNCTVMATVQGDILEHECGLTDMKLSAALGWLVCQWLLLTALNTKHTSEHQSTFWLRPNIPGARRHVRLPLFWITTQPVAALSHRRFRTPCRSVLFRILEH